MIFYNTPLKIEFNDDGLIVDGKKHPFTARMISELDEVLMEELHPDDDKPIYLMFRDVYRTDDLRYDITVVASRVLGKEYARTYGHYHPIAEDKMTYPEVYQVLFGEAKFILQKQNRDLSTDVIIVDASEGDCILIPPNYGHVTVNPSRKNPLFLANVVSNKFESEYKLYKKHHGPAVFYTVDDVKQNTNYIIKNLERETSIGLNSKYGFVCKDLLSEFYSDPKKFEFLNKPSMLFPKE